MENQKEKQDVNTKTTLKDYQEDHKNILKDISGALVRHFRRFLNLIASVKGYLYVIIFALCACINTILIKMAYTLSGSDATTIRYTVQLISMFILIKYKKFDLLGPKNQRKLLSLRALFNLVAMLCGVFAVKFINPSDFKAINHMSIIITAILARIFLKEKLTIAHIFAVILSIVGLLLITQPTFLFPRSTNTQIAINSTNFTDFNNTSFEWNSTNTNDTKNSKSSSHPFSILIGVAFGLVAAFGGGSARVILKRIADNKVHFSIATIYGSYYGLPISILLSTILTLTGLAHKDFKNEIPDLPIHILITVIAACFAVVGQIFLNLGLKYEEASRLSVVKTIDVFFAFLLQYVLLNIEVNLLNVIGALTVLTGALLVIIFKLIEKSEEKKKHSDSFETTDSPDSHQKNCLLKCILFKF